MQAMLTTLLALTTLVGPGRTPQDEHRALFDAIHQVETDGRHHVVGDGGRSRGPYQISAAYWKDACRHGGVNWSYSRHVWSRPHCEQVMKWYWDRYDARTDQQRARIHNGGPSGHRKSSTLRYWYKVRRELARRR